MRIAFLYLLFFALIGGCSVDNLEPNQTETFLKFYYETNEMESKDLIILNNGYLVLSTFSDTSTMLLKTDLLGNKIWAQSINYFKGSSLTETTDGYIVSGDSINTLDGTTFMQLIETNKETGARIGSTFIGTGTEHGAGVTFTANDEIIGLGYTKSNASITPDSIILMSYNTGLVKIWPSPRRYLSELPSDAVVEKEGLITWLSYYSNQKNVSLTTVLPNNEGNESNPTLFNGQTLTNTNGGFVSTPAGYGVVQSVINGNGESKIGFSSLINGIIDTEVIIEEGEFAIGNYNAYTVTNTLNGLLIAATTDNPGEATRTDADLLLLEIDSNGNLVLGGINQTFGGIGDEIPVRIRKAADGGYIILGTSINSKGAQQTFLLKTDNKGLLN
ncbi:MAG: hypothetical protein L3J06_08715 [Cyclobacteriaceae bacterium]|nr:hypothetical protein [Cyclobacteriaceae bacterium]